jgi:hypothetical protein
MISMNMFDPAGVELYLLFAYGTGYDHGDLLQDIDNFDLR